MEDRYNVECCDFIHAHEEIVEKVRDKIPGEDTLYDLTELFRIFADSTRIRILYVLLESEMCVCDIAALLGMTQSAISHQLRVLRQARLVRARREGRSVFYALDDGAPHSQAEISRHWLIPKTTLNTIVGDCVARGLIRLEGGREKYIRLTEAGAAFARRALDAVYALEDAAFARTLSRFSPEFVAALADFAQEPTAEPARFLKEPPQKP